MITSRDILAIAKRITKRKGALRERRIMYATRDWLIGLSIAIAVFLAGAVYAGLMFLSFNDIDERDVAMDTEVISYKQDVVLSALEQYRERQKQFTLLQSPPLPDEPERTQAATSSNESTIATSTDEVAVPPDEIGEFELE